MTTITTPKIVALLKGSRHVGRRPHEPRVVSHLRPISEQARPFC